MIQPPSAVSILCPPPTIGTIGALTSPDSPGSPLLGCPAKLIY